MSLHTVEMYGCTRYVTRVSIFACNRLATDAHFAPSNSAKVRVGPEFANGPRVL